MRGEGAPAKTRADVSDISTSRIFRNLYTDSWFGGNNTVLRYHDLVLGRARGRGFRQPCMCVKGALVELAGLVLSQDRVYCDIHLPVHTVN